MKALYIASTGMSAQERNVEVISNNIANMRTTGFKRSGPSSRTCSTRATAAPARNTSDQGTMVPVGIEIGSGVKTAATPRVMSQGSIIPTEKDLDIAIRGEGFFAVQLPDGRTAYTRDGSFERDSSGPARQRRRLPGAARHRDPGRRHLGLDLAPTAWSRPSSATTSTPTQLGQIQLARFVNKAGLEFDRRQPLRRDRRQRSAQVGVPDADGMGNLLQGYLEMANVNAVTEIADLIAAQRAYEMNARVISGADEMMSATSQLR